MLEINSQQLLSFDNANRARILKYIAMGLIKYKAESEQEPIHNEEEFFAKNINHIPYID